MERMAAEERWAEKGLVCAELEGIVRWEEYGF